MIIRNPVATILVTEVWKDPMAPYAASFSSRGPNPVTPDILKVKFIYISIILYLFLYYILIEFLIK